MSQRTNRSFLAILMALMLMVGLTVQPALANGTGGSSPNAVQPQAGNTLYLPVVMYNIETFEPNDTLQQAYGPLASGGTYASVISTKLDYDYYFINVTTLGNIVATLTTTAGQPSPLELTLYDPNGNVIGVTNSSLQSKQIVFTPTTTGKYYVRVCLCSLSLNPPQFYNLNVTFNGGLAPGDVSGQVFANGGPRGGVPIYLRRFDYVSQAQNLYFTVSDAGGGYHFRGVASISGTQVLMVVYDGSLGASFIQLAQSNPFAGYSAGGALNTGIVDITPITLMGPVNGTSGKLPMTFTWTPRNAAPSAGESYAVIFYDPNNPAISFTSPLVGHNGTYTLSSLPAGFVLNHTYAWIVNGQITNGPYDFSWPNTVTFTP